MPVSFCGTWEMISNVNMEGYMKALGEFPVCCVVWVFCMQDDARNDLL